MKTHKKPKQTYKSAEEAERVHDNNNSPALVDDEQEYKNPSSNFFVDLKQSASLRIVTFLLIVTLTFFLCMRYLDFRNEKLEGEYSLEFSLTDDRTTENKAFNDIININTADKFELIQLKGIGETKAEAIVDYRKINGEFTCIEDIMNVKGIGENIFNSIKDNITV